MQILRKMLNRLQAELLWRTEGSECWLGESQIEEFRHLRFCPGDRTMPENFIFCKIASRQIPVDPIYEDDEFIAFRDQNPQAPVHVLLIPKDHFETVLDVADTGKLGR